LNIERISKSFSSNKYSIQFFQQQKKRYIWKFLEQYNERGSLLDNIFPTGYKLKMRKNLFKGSKNCGQIFIHTEKNPLSLL